MRKKIKTFVDVFPLNNYKGKIDYFKDIPPPIVKTNTQTKNSPQRAQHPYNKKFVGEVSKPRNRDWEVPPTNRDRDVAPTFV
ncbi:hypothetical protein KAX29_07665 [candidate division WOR-3 bacterium]|nr:hypothetical protein [candidate division WOR-3 bacterium]